MQGGRALNPPQQYVLLDSTSNLKTSLQIRVSTSVLQGSLFCHLDGASYPWKDVLDKPLYRYGLRLIWLLDIQELLSGAKRN